MANSRLFIFILLLIIGLFVHYPSFYLSLYGDDWLTIYLYFVPDGDPARFGSLPGLLSFLTPYGPSILLIGKLYEIFSTNYYFYFIVSFILKLFASWVLFLSVQQITKSKIISFLVSLLFLVGFTGIQTTDWVFYMNVYLAAALFFLSVYFQFKFFETYKKKDLIYQLLFSITAIIAAPVRLFPLILTIPLTEIVLYFNRKKEISRVAAKLAIFFIIIILLWIIGVFGGVGRIYSPDAWSIKEFFEFIVKNPLYSLNSFLYWIGIVTFPDYPNVQLFKPELTGFLFLTFFTLGLVLSRKDREKFTLIMISGLTFLIFLISMWFYSKLRLSSSSDRYLLLPFAGFCILTGILSARFFNYFKIGVIFFLVMLIGINFLATKSIYSYWLDQGRSSDYISAVDAQLKKDFPKPLKSLTIIYIEPDDAGVEQSTVFGMAFKIAVFSKTWNDNLIPHVVDEKKVLIKKIDEQIAKGAVKEDVISNVYGYKIHNKKFTSITPQIRAELLLL